MGAHPYKPHSISVRTHIGSVPIFRTDNWSVIRSMLDEGLIVSGTKGEDGQCECCPKLGSHDRFQAKHAQPLAFYVWTGWSVPMTGPSRYGMRN
jgi:hypothetical protein